MFIKSIVIDGFKSYAQRTEINGFDPLFNAITGLNGSGKSNILDSICFLLGISNLSHVRASNLQDLVYKNGQAGVTKATVSITFDNTDKTQSPLGYEQYDELTVTRQVVIGGRNKYLINGVNANNTRVQDLFRSVQLNINNPHFLIMQGRITKVLNMKPLEILSMIEEAAGTRLYESKKESAQKTIEKKDMKLRDIDTILEEEITPTLTKLKAERASYLEYQKITRELEHLNKLFIAFKFFSAEETKTKSANNLLEMQASIKKLKDDQEEISKKILETDQIISELETKRDAEAGGELKRIEAELSELQKTNAKAQADMQHKKESLKAEQKKHKEITKNFQNDKTVLASKEKEVCKLQDVLKQLKEQNNQANESHELAKKHFHAVSAGLSTNKDGEDATLNDQLMAAKKEISNADTELQQSQMRLKHAQQAVKEKQNDLKKTEQTYKSDKDAHNSLKRALLKIEENIKKLGYEDGKEERLLQEKRQLVNQVHQIREKMENLESRFPQLQFEYKNPEKNFDRRRVYGLVAKLIRVKNPKTATALEVAAGGKLYNVVVDTEVTGKQLLQNGELKKRYTIIPLNKISARSIEPHVVQKAERLVGKDNVNTALSLVGYESDLNAAMKFVFGNSFVCPEMNIAKRVAFDQEILRKCITLEGDSFDPSGTLTGGSRGRGGSLLLKLDEFMTVENELLEKQTRLETVERDLKNLAQTADRFRNLKQEYDLKVHESTLLDERLKQTTHHQQLEEIELLKLSIDEQQKNLTTAKEVHTKATAKTKELENKIKNSKAIRENEMKEAEKAIKDSKKKMEESNKKTKEKEQEVEAINLEMEELKKELKNYTDQLAAVDEAIKQLEVQLTQLTEAADQTKKAVSEVQVKLNEQKDMLKACDKNINLKVREKQACQKQINSAQLRIQELEHTVSKSSKESKDAAKMVEDMLQSYSWIADERKFFGQANSAFDFSVNDPHEAGRRIQKLQNSKDKLSKNVNMRAMNMLGKAEEQYSDLMKKRKIVLNDKTKIAAVIAELDEKKNEALKKAHKQVNKDFGSIFSTLLPGTQAKLVAPDGLSILEGVEVKVAFGDVWKESLTELSGGQRSLVALSLILSLLLFKPAPLYILDEVDAALDLSHTQNIGQMLRTHFQHSQFIVVSLKDGMFTNANVLFKTKFVDGVSTVQRFSQAQSSKTSVNLPTVKKPTKQHLVKKRKIDESMPLTDVH